MAGYPPGAIPVAAGAGWSLTDGGDMGEIPDHDTFWGGPDVEPGFVDPTAAVGVLDRSVAAGATICTIGPLTNLALLEAARPGRLGSATIVAMGGWVRALPNGYPDWSARHDFNIQCDPDAAATVFSAAGDLTLVTLGATVQTHLREADLVRLEASGPLGALLARMTRSHAKQHDLAGLADRFPALPGDLRNFHHDPLAAAVAVGWTHGVRERLRLRPVMEGERDELLRFEPVAPVPNPDGGLGEHIPAIEVRSRPEPTVDRVVQVIDDVDGPAFVAEWLDVVEALSRSRADLAGSA